MKPIILDTANWEITPHRHTPYDIRPDIQESENWHWQPLTLPFDAISWLHANGHGPDPFQGQNDLQYSWVEDVDWVLRHRFSLPAGFKSADDEALFVCNNIDCYFDVFLNNIHIGKGLNQFREHLLDVDENLLGTDNTVIIYIRSARNVTSVLENAYGQLPAGFDNGRVHARRCQSYTGWDYTPRLSSVAMQTPPEIRANSPVQFPGLAVHTLRITPAGPGQGAAESAHIQLIMDIQSRRKASGTMNITIVEADSGKPVYTGHESIDIKARPVSLRRTLDLENARLWWPLGLGAQPLYQATVTFSITDKLGYAYELTQSATFGIRTIAVDRSKDHAGESFTPLVNGHPVFCRGANWLPTSILPGQVNPADLRVLVTAAAGAGLNCLRVWGGGTYESDLFYDLCDRLGILVWQDFMFACAAYPTYREFMDEVEAEATYQVRRLRNHPSLLLWCGNNEIEWLHQTGELKKGNEQKVIGESIWAHLIRDVVEQHDPERYYHQSSPFGKSKAELNEESSGDRHSWEVWANWKSSETYLLDKGRFVSEFGIQSLPSIESIRRFAPGADSIHHPDLVYHQRQIEGNERLIRYVMSDCATPGDLEEWISSSQRTQAEILAMAVEHWRARRFETSGCLLWHFHDAYPAISWSLIDAYRLPKLAYTASRRFFNPVLLCMQLLVNGVPVPDIPPEAWMETNPLKVSSLEIAGGEGVACQSGRPAIQFRFHIINDTCHTLAGDITYEIIHAAHGVVLRDSMPASIEANGSAMVALHNLSASIIADIRHLHISAKWELDEDSRNRLTTLGQLIRDTQGELQGRDIENFDRTPWLFDPFAGLSLSRHFVSEKYRIQ